MAHKTIISVGGRTFGPFPFNEAMRKLFAEVVAAEIDPIAYRDCLPNGDKWKIWVAQDVGTYPSLLAACLGTPQLDHGRTFLPDRYFLREREVVTTRSTSYVMSTQWGFAADGRTRNEFIPKIQAAFPHLQIDVALS